MAASKTKSEGVRLTHRNGGTVLVTDEKAARLVAGGNFTPVAAKRTAAKTED